MERDAYLFVRSIRTAMNSKRPVTTLAFIIILTLVIGCSNGEAATTSGSPAPENRNQPVSINQSPKTDDSSRVGQAVNRVPNSNTIPVGGVTANISATGQTLETSSTQAGIWVTGIGKINIEPDLAVVSVGVETESKTVTLARDKAATAMAAVVKTLKSYGLADTDIQTRSFNIYPKYDYHRDRGQIFVGYTVRNEAAIKIRDLDEVGPIIDAVADAGGDAARINGISFTLENQTPFMARLREMAVTDALEKAAHFAELIGVSVGNIIFISEGNQSTPMVSPIAGRRMAMEAMAAPTTEISGGELQLSMSVQAVFDIHRE